MSGRKTASQKAAEKAADIAEMNRRVAAVRGEAPAVSDEDRARRVERAKRRVADAVVHCKRKYGNGWEFLSREQRRCVLSNCVLAEIGGIETESANVAVYCVALANEVFGYDL